MGKINQQDNSIKHCIILLCANCHREVHNNMKR